MSRKAIKAVKTGASLAVQALLTGAFALAFAVCAIIMLAGLEPPGENQKRKGGDHA